MKSPRRPSDSTNTSRGKPSFRGSLFGRMQRRLTLTYSFLTVALLALFVLVVYFLLSYIVLNSQRNNLKSLITLERAIMEKSLQSDAKKSTLDSRKLWGSGSDQLFYYLIDTKGGLVAGNEMFSAMRPELLQLVQSWKHGKEEIKDVELLLPQEVLENEEYITSLKTSKLNVMIAREDVLIKNKSKMTIYVGINVTAQYQLLRGLLILLVVLAIVFVFIACLIGWMMSRKAMTPVVQSYTRQREFVGDASHELRTPLSVLMASVNAMELELGKDASSFTKKTFVNMKDEIRRMTRMVQDLLLLARSDSGEIELMQQPFDFHRIAEETIQSIHAIGEAQNISITLGSDSPVNIRGDSDKLRQVLTILLDNAIKHTPANGHIDVNLSQDSKVMLRLSVQDNGSGIPEEDRERIFDRFYRGDTSRTRSSGGHGLGLSIAKWIVEAHHGHIYLISEKGKGSQFIVEIPRVKKMKNSDFA